MSVRGQMKRPRVYRTCGLQHTAPIWTGKEEGAKRGEWKGNEVVG